MNLNVSQFGNSKRGNRTNRNRQVQPPLSTHQVVSIDDRLKFAQLIQMLSTPTWQGGAK